MPPSRERDALEAKGVTRLDKDNEPVKIRLGMMPRDEGELEKGVYYLVPVLQVNNWLQFTGRNGDYREGENFTVRPIAGNLEKYTGGTDLQAGKRRGASLE